MKRESPYLLKFALSFLYLSGARGSSILELLPEPHAFESFNHSDIQNLGDCSYTVVITTSCCSTAYTRDHISIAFGDESGHKVVAPKLDEPSAGAFERCGSDMFLIKGPCTNRVCSVYLYRTGPDGWVPESVQVYSCYWRPVTFYYNTLIPNEFWYGYNMCSSAAPSTGNNGRNFMGFIHGFIVSAFFYFYM